MASQNMSSFVIELGFVGQNPHLELGQNTHLVTQHLTRGVQSQTELKALCLALNSTATTKTVITTTTPQTSITDKGIRI